MRQFVIASASFGLPITWNLEEEYMCKHISYGWEDSNVRS